MTSPRARRRRLRRAIRRRRFTTETAGIFETPAETRIIHEIPKVKP